MTQNTTVPEWLRDHMPRPLDIGIVRGCLVKLGLKKTDADRRILSAVEAGADKDEVAMIRWCLRS